MGCGGGGGGGGSGSAGVTPFSTWSAITPNSTVRVEGNSQEVSYTANSSTDRVTSVSSVSPNQDGAYYQSSYGSDGRANAVTLRSAKGTTVSWSTAKGDTIARIATGPYAGINAAISAGEGPMQDYQPNPSSMAGTTNPLVFGSLDVDRAAARLGRCLSAIPLQSIPCHSQARRLTAAVLVASTWARQGNIF